MTKPPSETLPPRDHNRPPQLLADYFTRDELAEQLGKCTRTLERWNRLGQGPPLTMLGDTPLYRKQSVYTWLASLEQRRVAEKQKRRRRSG